MSCRKNAGKTGFRNSTVPSSHRRDTFNGGRQSELAKPCTFSVEIRQQSWELAVLSEMLDVRNAAHHDKECRLCILNSIALPEDDGARFEPKLCNARGDFTTPRGADTTQRWNTLER